MSRRNIWVEVCLVMAIFFVLMLLIGGLNAKIAPHVTAFTYWASLAGLSLGLTASRWWRETLQFGTRLGAYKALHDGAFTWLCCCALPAAAVSFLCGGASAELEVRSLGTLLILLHVVYETHMWRCRVARQNT